MNLIAHCLIILIRIFFSFRSLVRITIFFNKALQSSALLLKMNIEYSTSIDFTENQLSLNLISLSPLFTNLPCILPHTRVRSFSTRLDRVNLFINSSFSFGSDNFNYDNFSSPERLAKTNHSLTHDTKGTLFKEQIKSITFPTNITTNFKFF
jgi:hypothetical protein